MAERTLVIMVKEPVAGQVKTRLANEVGVVRATEFYRHSLEALIARLSPDRRWQTVLSLAPAASANTRMLPGGVRRMVQVDGDLGQRMQAVFELPIRGPIALIGSDIPAIRGEHIAAAFRELGRNDVVFGPATDGGFWLVGMSRSPRPVRPFTDIRWSTNHALGDCIQRLAGHRVGVVTTLDDVDNLRDLQAAGGLIGRRVLPTTLRT